VTDWRAYERRKAVWTASHPGATPEEYEQAALREFCGDESRKPRLATEKRDLPAPGLRSYLAAQGEI